MASLQMVSYPLDDGTTLVAEWRKHVFGAEPGYVVYRASKHGPSQQVRKYLNADAALRACARVVERQQKR